ncbi:MAG: tetratricopeptide repeat protein [Nitrospirota bacterium]|nr:tetratricopeptide repeat protein [Nitrospirota bacterium]
MILVRAIALAFSIICLATSAWANLQADNDAYKSGDYATALSEWRPLAEQAHAVAQYNLGWLYFKGQGVPRDYAQARHWWKKAAAQGQAEAQLALAQMYERGEGVKLDYTKAASWYRLAAEQEVAEAQFRLGQYYTSGLGVETDEKISGLWYRLAARQGHEEAIQAVGQELTTDEVAQLEEFSRSWKPMSSAQLDEMLREEGKLTVTASGEYGPLSAERRWQLAIFVVGAGISTYIICGLFWLRFNKKKPAPYQIMASDAVVILLWPLGFYNAHLRKYWAQDRFRISDPEAKTGIESVGFIQKFGSHSRITVKSWKEALSRAQNLASTLNHSVYITDSAKYDNDILGGYWNRLYCVEASGEVRIISVSPSRVIRKCKPEKTRQDSSGAAGAGANVKQPLGAAQKISTDILITFLHPWVLKGIATLVGLAGWGIRGGIAAFGIAWCATMIIGNVVRWIDGGIPPRFALRHEAKSILEAHRETAIAAYPGLNDHALQNAIVGKIEEICRAAGDQSYGELMDAAERLKKEEINPLRRDLITAIWTHMERNIMVALGLTPQ